MTSRAQTQKAAFALLSISGLVVMIPAVAVIYFIVVKGLPAISWSFLTEMPRQGMREGGIMPAIVGTAYLLAGTLFFAVPLGILAAIYLTEYAPVNAFTRTIRLAIVNLAGVPSIVYGLFGYGLFVLFLHFGKSVLAGSLTLALLILPVVITSSEEALLSVPKSFRDGSLALGATKWQTIWRVVLPNSAAGIITGVILGIGRAAGETAPIMFTAAAFYLPRLPRSVFDDCMALPYHLYVVASEMFDSPEKVQWGTAFTLLMIVLAMNLVAAVIRARFRRSRSW
ncbi:MAG: phosphate ABC transporter permease PstA [Armatimonadetes bacterium]|nr:phosphate ABC transporter permease PstA [Armatimonadota bacterium]